LLGRAPISGGSVMNLRWSVGVGVSRAASKPDPTVQYFVLCLPIGQTEPLIVLSTRFSNVSPYCMYVLPLYQSFRLGRKVACSQYSHPYHITAALQSGHRSPLLHPMPESSLPISTCSARPLRAPAHLRPTSARPMGHPLLKIWRWAREGGLPSGAVGPSPR
jgi:hypothetical protein